MPATGGANQGSGVGYKAQRVNAFDLASLYLKQANVPDTTDNRRILAAWFMSESQRVSGSSTDIYVVGGNPLNLTGTGSGGSRTAFGHNFAVYNTYADGAKAWWGSLNAPWGTKYGYNDIASGFKSGNANAVEQAIIDSGWVTGKRGNQYGTPPDNLLEKVYAGLGGVNTNVTGSLPDGSSPPGQPNIGTPLTEDVIKKMVDILHAQNMQAGHDPVSSAISENIYRSILESHKGELWSADLAKSIQTALGQSANEANPANTYLKPLTDIAGSAGKLVDPNNWSHVGLILLGGIIVLAGGIVIFKNVTGGAGAEGMVSPMPIILREGA